MAREKGAGCAADQGEAEQAGFGDTAITGNRALLVLMETQDRPEIDRDQRDNNRRQKGSQRRRSVNFI